MNRRDDGYNNSGRENNFDRMFNAREYGNGGGYDDYQNNYSAGGYSRRPSRSDYGRNNQPRENYNREEGYGNNVNVDDEAPRRRSIFRRRDRENNEVNNQNMGANQFVVMTPKNFDDIKGTIDNLKLHRALIVDVSRLNDKSVQRVMDYINGAIYALDGSIQRINEAVFLLTPTGMGISVPIDYIKDKWARKEKNKKK